MKLPIGTFSNYNALDNCPFKFWHMYVLKDLPRVESPEMKWGNEVHSALEKRVRDKTPLPDTMKAAEPVAGTLSRLHVPIYVEHKLAIDGNGRSVDFWADDCWFRGKLDVVVHSPEFRSAWLLDWKTGKTREEPLELETGALLVKAAFPELENIVGEYFWLQTGQNGMRYTLNNHTRTFDKLHGFRKTVEDCAASGHWPKNKNSLCGWCPVTSCENNTSHRRR